MFPALIQLPFLYAFYRVLDIAIEMRDAVAVGGDLSQPETLAIHVLPIILIASQFLAQKMTPATGMDPNQQKMMMFMPLMYGFMFYYASCRACTILVNLECGDDCAAVIINRMMPLPRLRPPLASCLPESRR